jgi:uncharacterized lipoprotein YmbA
MRQGLRLLPVLALLALGTACGGGAGISYYLIDSEPGPVLRGEGPLAVEIIDLDVPQYLERLQLVSRTSGNQLAYAVSHQWGEPLRKTLARVLAEHLATVLSTADVATPHHRLSSRPELRLQVHLDRFERGVDGRVELRGRFQLTAAADGRVLATERVDVDGGPRIADGDYTALVASMQARYAEFAQRVARVVAAHADEGS